MYLPEEVEFIISKLLSHGFTAEVVGGAVRDFLLGHEPNDYDVTTSATPSEIKEVFKASKTVDTGIKHGTVTVVLKGKPYEITTYRIDGEYLDARRPESVSFTRSIQDDLSRRDFTVNAMAYSTRFGLIDLFSGKRDLKNGIIRAVGSAEKRFSEDALRILRALRFASKLDFAIDEETSAAIYQKAQLLSRVARERIYVEWQKLLKGPGAYRIINEYKEVIKVFLPELDEISLPYEKEFSACDSDLRFISLFCEKGSDAWCKALDGLRADNKTKLFGKALLENLEVKLDSAYEMKHMLSKIGEEYTKKLIDFRRLMKLGSKGEEQLLNGIIESGECYRLADLKISGNDLVKMGVRGKQTGEILSSALDAVMSGKVKNEREELLFFVGKLRPRA